MEKCKEYCDEHSGLTTKIEFIHEDVKEMKTTVKGANIKIIGILITLIFILVGMLGDILTRDKRSNTIPTTAKISKNMAKK